MEYNVGQLAELIENEIERLSYPQQPEGLYAPIRYTLEGGGKRLRPVLVLASCMAVCGDASRALSQALAVEMFHNFTLLHDDVMDNADVRRGRPTVHRRWNASQAILSGDAMLTYATQIVARCPQDKIAEALHLFNRTAMEVYEGQQMDMDFERRDEVLVDEYLEMIRLKTSVLLGCACRMGAIMADAPNEVADAFYRYGERLGMAFQLKDDYLDTFGDPAIFGKEIGGDILNGKKTWLWITALSEDTSGTMHKVLDSNLKGYEKIEEVKGVYNNLNLPERCHELINSYIDEAVEAIRSANLSPAATTFFVDLAQNTSKRDH